MALFALVQFLFDSKKLIVPVGDIKNFSPIGLKDFNKIKKYSVMWPSLSDVANLNNHERTFYEATILALSESEKSLLSLKRVAPPPLAQLISSSETDEPVVSEKVITSPPEKGGDKRKRSSEYWESDDAVEDMGDIEESVPRRELDAVRHKLAYAEADLEILRKKVRSQDKEIKELGNMNLMLQRTVLENLKQLNDLERSSDAGPGPSSLSDDREELYVSVGGFKVGKTQYAVAKAAKTNAIFVKEMALLLWEGELASRSVTGTIGPRAKEGPPKKKLSPEKLCVIRDELRRKLQGEGFVEAAVATELRLVNRHIAQKIADLNRKKNK